MRMRFEFVSNGVRRVPFEGETVAVALWKVAAGGYSRESRRAMGAFAGMHGRQSGMAGGVVAVGPGRAVEQRGRGRGQGPEQAAAEAARLLDDDGRIGLVPMLVIDVLEEVAGRDHFFVSVSER